MSKLKGLEFLILKLVSHETPPIQQTPNSLYLGCDPSYENGQISISSAIHPLNKSIFDYGNIYIELMEPLKSNWIANGKQGAGFALQADGRIQALNESFTLDDLPMTNCENLVIEVTFEPFTGAKVCAFDVIQLDAQGNITGGERFEYRPQTGQPQAAALVQIEPSGSGNPNSQIEVFPNPVNYEVNIQLNQVMGGRVHVELYSPTGKLMSKSYFEGEHSKTETVSVAHLSSGLYILHIYNDRREIDESFKLIKQ